MRRRKWRARLRRRRGRDLSFGGGGILLLTTLLLVVSSSQPRGAMSWMMSTASSASDPSGVVADDGSGDGGGGGDDDTDRARRLADDEDDAGGCSDLPSAPAMGGGGGRADADAAAAENEKLGNDSYDDFASWCVNDMRIRTLLYVDHFDYPPSIGGGGGDDDTAAEGEGEDNAEDVGSMAGNAGKRNASAAKVEGMMGPGEGIGGAGGDTGEGVAVPSKSDSKSVRGLAASRDIRSGEVVISVPFDALISLATVESDPVLSPAIGRDACRRNGWYDELQILVVYLLYQRSLGRDRSPWGRYVSDVLGTSVVDDMPFLWSRQRLGAAYPDPTDGVRVAAEAIAGDVRAMYDEVVPVLVRSHPDVFAPPEGWVEVEVGGDGDGAEEDVGGGGPTRDDAADGGRATDRVVDWAYSFENFRWAFAMLNSRHWHLPCEDLDFFWEGGRGRSDDGGMPPAVESNFRKEDAGYDVIPPLRRSEEEGDGGGGEKPTTTPSDAADVAGSKTHTFLAPMADLLNFGPPCTRAEYNLENKTLDIVATCDFVTGEEVTFWYTNECQDIVTANFGFSHPLISKCLSLQDWKERSEQLQALNEDLEVRLEDAQLDIDYLRSALEAAERKLSTCGYVDDDDGDGDNDAKSLGGQGREGLDGGVNGHLLRRDRAPDTGRRNVGGIRRAPGQQVPDDSL